MQTTIVLALLAIVICLGAALFFMWRGAGQGRSAGRPMLRALALRVGLSVLLLLGLLLAWQLGYLQPHGAPLR